MFKVAPLSSSFMLLSMFGFIISAFFLNHPIFNSWAWAFIVVFVSMFISSMISLSKTPIGKTEHLDELAIHTNKHYRRRN